MYLRVPLFLGLVIFSVSLPDPTNIVVMLGAIGLGAGIGVGSGVAAYLERTGKARIKMLREYEEVYKGSTIERAEEAERKYAEMSDQVVKNSAKIHEIEESSGAQIAQLREQLSEAQGRVMEQAEILKNVAVTILTERNYLLPGARDVS